MKTKSRPLRRDMQFGRRSTNLDMQRTLARVRKLAEREARRTPEGKIDVDKILAKS
jgi:hypothetical protein